jgi:hypothetical protein
MRRSIKAIALAVLAVSACGDGPTGSRAESGIVITAGAGTTDTIQATPVQALTVRVNGADGKPAGGVLVRFAGVIAGSNPQLTTMTVGTLVGTDFEQTVVGTTDESGVASVRVRFGTIAGEGYITATVPALGFQETARYNVTPGAVARTAITPRDVLVSIDGSASLRASVTDRFGNARPEVPTLTGPDGTSFSGSTVTASRFGRHVVRATYPGAFPDSAVVSALPRGRLAGVRGYPGNTLVMIDLDGGNRLAVPLMGTIYGIDWAPDGRVVASVGNSSGPTVLQAVTELGRASTFLTGSTVTNEGYPVFSPDGKSVFFAGRAPNSFSNTLWRANADGTGIQSSSLVLGFSWGVVYGPSPDGTKVVHSGTIHDLQTQVRTSLGTPDVPSWRWSPLGDLIAYASHDVVGVIRPDGTGRRILWSGFTGFADRTIDWSGDGKYLVFRTGSGSLEMIEVASGARAVLPFASDLIQAVLQ